LTIGCVLFAELVDSVAFKVVLAVGVEGVVVVVDDESVLGSWLPDASSVFVSSVLEVKKLEILFPNSRS
jgi:hypothetical protein